MIYIHAADIVVSWKRFLRGPFTARLAAQRNARAFQSTLGEREHAVDAHTLALLDNLYDPALFKVNNACIGHGRMLARDGKMTVKVRQ